MNTSEVCFPIKTLKELEEVLKKPPVWAKDATDLKQRSSFKILNNISDCHVSGKSDLSTPRVKADLVPRTLVCHDMKNGYLEDRFVNGTSTTGYTFYRWNEIDTFVYFSHHFITVPPISWINLAHGNGVEVLGTFITEWDLGETQCKEFLQDDESIERLAQSLADLLVVFNFDGWLINIENDVNDVSKLLAFVQSVAKYSHEKRPNSRVLWYDSVINDGTLKWQNELNQNNRCFFDACDGIFVNYTWKDLNLSNSAESAKDRRFDVYVGVDVFGRNTFYEQGFDCHKAAHLIRKLNFSMALFAPGWSHETLPAEPEATFLGRFIERENSLWNCLWPHLFSSPINQLFQTTFHVGTTSKAFNLANQQTQLTSIIHPKNALAQELHSRCECLQLVFKEDNQSCLIINQNNEEQLYHHLFSLDISIQGTILMYAYERPCLNGKTCSLDICILIKENKVTKKIVCSTRENFEIDGKKPGILLKPCSNLICPYLEARKPANCFLKCFLLNFESTVTLLKVFALVPCESSIELCGFGFKLLPI